ncbi:MAG: T9SS type A sorting domain-containing protein [Bacteroidia bacterium]|nr:T9SS type A sorting domain-containing protein [Bacteroidia bacterium]
MVNTDGTNIIIRRNDNSSSSAVSVSLFTNATYTRPLYGIEEMGPLCDLDNDGRPDLITSRQAFTSTVNANLLISRNTYIIETPTTNVSSASYSSLSGTSMTITINTPGNGTGRVILIKQGSVAISAFPVNYTYYAATKNYGTSPVLGDGSRVVYVGDTNVITITGLNASTGYKVAVLEMNGWANATNYLTAGAYTITATTLPVKWLSFEGKKVAKEVQLIWQTASEINNSYFELERKFDNEQWHAIGKVKGNGSKSTASEYNYTDNNIMLSVDVYATVYYRLKQVDVDGLFDYSSEISIMLNQNKPVEQLEAYTYPMPFDSIFNIKTNQRDFEYILTDCSGKELIKGKSESSSVLIDGFDLSPGLYIATIITANQQTKVLKIIKANDK